MKSRLPQIIEEQGIKKKYICEKVEINKSTMTRLLNGSLPSLPVAYKIAKLLNKRIEDIWYFEE